MNAGRVCKVFYLLAVLGLLSGSTANVTAQDDAENEGKIVQKKRRVIRIPGFEDADVDVEVVKVPKYWIGVRCEQSEGGDVIVLDVLDDSPAEEAGIKAGDQILKIGDAKLDGVKVLIDEVNEHGEDSVDLTIRRGGEEIEISVKPQRRPDLGAGTLNLNDFEDVFEALPHAFRERDDVLRFIQPGLVIGEDLGEFPSGVRVKIERKNDDPATITIERDGKEWTVTEDSLDELPKDLRPWARRMLSSTGQGDIRSRIGNRIRPNTRPGIRRFTIPEHEEIRKWIQKPETADTDDSELEKEIKELREQVEELRELIEKLHDED